MTHKHAGIKMYTCIFPSSLVLMKAGTLCKCSNEVLSIYRYISSGSVVALYDNDHVEYMVINSYWFGVVVLKLQHVDCFKVNAIISMPRIWVLGIHNSLFYLSQSFGVWLNFNQKVCLFSVFYLISSYFQINITDLHSTQRICSWQYHLHQTFCGW